MDLSAYINEFDFEYEPGTYLAYKYRLKYVLDNEAQELESLIVIDKLNKNIAYPKIDKESDNYKDSWSNLDNHKCTNCPLKSEDSPKCPVAIRMQPIVDKFQGIASFDNIQLEIETEQRNYNAKTSAQNAIQSLFGLMMGASGCPILHRFYPMAVFHLPLSSLEETLIRTISFHLLNQYISGEKIELDSLDDLYQDVQLVNDGISKRLRELEKKSDTSKNAIVILNTFAQMFLMEYTLDLEDLKKYF